MKRDSIRTLSNRDVAAREGPRQSMRDFCLRPVLSLFWFSRFVVGVLLSVVPIVPHNPLPSPVDHASLPDAF